MKDRTKIYVFVFGCQTYLFRFLYRFRLGNSGRILNAVLLANKATTQECSGQCIVVNQINMVPISLAGLPLNDFHRGAVYQMTKRLTERWIEFRFTRIAVKDVKRVLVRRLKISPAL